MNTNGTLAWRTKFREARLQQVLRNALIAEKICDVDRSADYTIHNPYSSQPTAAVTAIASAGTYSVSAWTTTNDTLTVSDEIAYGEHVFGFERLLSNFDLFSDRVDNQSYAVADKIDALVLNEVCDKGTGAYTTPAGGFTSAANFLVIMSNLLSKVAGYQDVAKGLFLVIENTDLPGVIQAQGSQGFSLADAVLNNGFMSSYMGVDIYVVRSGRFVTDTIGSLTFTNSGHRVFGVKGVATYASPRSFDIMEKDVTGKTGKEIATATQIGIKVWTQKAPLIVDITLA